MQSCRQDHSAPTPQRQRRLLHSIVLPLLPPANHPARLPAPQASQLPAQAAQAQTSRSCRETRPTSANLRAMTFSQICGMPSYHNVQHLLHSAVVGTVNTEGEILLNIQDSQYSSIAQLHGMLGEAVSAFVNSPTGKNCQTVLWTSATQTSDGECPKGSTKPSLYLGERDVLPPTNLCEGTSKLCNGANLISK